MDVNSLEVQTGGSKSYRFLTPFSLPLLFLATAAAILLGLFVNINTTESTATNILYFFYYVSWFVRFYPQIILNFKRGATAGLSTDYVGWFLLSQLAGFLVAVSKYFVEEEPLPFTSASLADVIANCNGLLCMTLITAHMISKGEQRNQLPSSFLLSLIVLVIVVYIAFIIASKANTGSDLSGYFVILVEYLGYFTLVAQTLRFPPQISQNIKCRGFIGIDICSVALDLVGALAQILYILYANTNYICSGLDCKAIYFDHYFPLSLNVVIGLSDIILMVQFSLYRNNYVAFNPALDPLLSSEVSSLSIMSAPPSYLMEAEVGDIDINCFINPQEYNEAYDNSFQPEHSQQTTPSEWSCTRCTMLNPIESAVCSVCQYNRLLA